MRNAVISVAIIVAALLAAFYLGFIGSDDGRGILLLPAGQP
jgi:hypothetical protein